MDASAEPTPGRGEWLRLIRRRLPLEESIAEAVALLAGYGVRVCEEAE